MRTDVEYTELPARWTEVVALAKAGDEVVLTEQGNALVKLVLVQGAVGFPPSATQRKTPIPGLRPDAIVLAPDFNEPLPDEFWMGEE